MNKWYGLGIAIVLFFYSFKCYCNQNNYSFNHISIEQRLPGENVYCVYQDQKGLMWFAIESVGLCKYNGKTFTVYENVDTDLNTLSNNFPLCIVEDLSGNIWVGTTKGLNELDRNNGAFKRYLYSPNSDNCIPNNYITDLHVDKYNNIWIATRKGISKYIKSQNKFYNLLVGEGEYSNGSPAMVSTFYEDSSGNIWIGSYSSGLFKVDHETNLKHTTNPENELTINNCWLPIDKKEKHLSNYAVQQICKYDDNTLLIGKIDGLCLFNLNTEIFTKYPVQINPLLNKATVSSLHRDKTGVIWVGYATMGLVLINVATNEQHYFDANTYLPKGLRSNTIRDIYEDKSGLIWIATKFQGIHTYNKRQEIFNQHKYNAILNERINNKFVLSVFEDSQGFIWIGTKNNGIYRFNPSNNEIINYTSKHLTNQYYISNNRVECITEDTFGNIWAGTEGGIHKLAKNSLRFKSCNDYFIRCIAADKQGNLWIGTNSSGVLYCDIKTNKVERYNSFNEKEFFENASYGTRAISITSDSLLWISTYQSGLYKYNTIKDKLTHYLNNPDDFASISSNMVRGVFEDNTGKIWIGTKASGLNIYNIETGNFSHIKERNGFPPNSVYNILQDNNLNYWMGSNEGLFTLNKKTGVHTHYNKTDGLKSNIFEVNACCITSNELMIFGGSEGLNVFNPDNIHKFEYDASLVISSIKVYDKIVAEDINEYKELSISFNEKYISIEFALTEYSDPLKIKYKYKLENFDKDWIESGNRNFATYTALPPGNYRFKLIAAAQNSKWIDKPLTIKITITSPLWRKPAFIFVCIVSLIVLAIIIYIARLRFIRKNEIKLKKLVEAKTRDLMDLNQELEEHKENLESIVEERTHDLNEARNKAVEGDRLKSAFLANMSHEIRTPLNAIIGLSNILISELPPEEENTYLGELIESNAKALQQLIDDIIDISKIEANQIEILKEVFPLNSCIKNVADIYKKHVNVYKKFIDVNIDVEIPAEEIFLESDQIRIEQILKNLINNSLKFTKKGYVKVGYLIITKENSEKSIRFFVKDTGIGIPEKDLDRVFNRFEKSETRENILHGGTGLGLSISYNLTKLLGGKMWVESKVNKGSQFYFEIPFKQVEGSHAKESIKITQNIHEYNWKNKNVLIAEDIDVNYYVLMNALKSTGINIIRVKDGLAAVNEITKVGGKIYDIVLMDIKMPKLSGIEALRHIKNFNNSIPVIAQTAFAMNYEEREILKSGFDDFISKPLNRKLLLEKMAKFLE